MKSEQVHSDHSLTDRKIRDRSLVLLVVGCLLLTPPLASVFQIDIRIMGIPFTGLYLFTVWGALIIGAAVLSRRMQSQAERDDASTGKDESG